MAGIVYLVGAGPGDPGLLTLRAERLLRHCAEVVVADALVSPDVVALARGADVIMRGARRSGLKQDEINALLVEKAREGKTVVRLKGGDPFIFGRGGEEAEYLAAHGIPFEIVPGVTSGIAAAAYAGIPLTHRGKAGAVAFLTGHEADDKDGGAVDWHGLARAATTIVAYMSVEHLPSVVARLIEAGRAPETPVAVISHGTLPSQRVVTGILSDIASRVGAANFSPPSLTVIGDVVSLRPSLNWFETRPLFGARVLFTRRDEEINVRGWRRLEALGAEVLVEPCLEVRDAESPSLDAAVADVQMYKCVAFASQIAVSVFARRLADAGRDVRALAGATLAAVGDKTAAAMRMLGMRADLIADESTGEGLAKALANVVGPVLLPRAAEGRDVVEKALLARGLRVDVVEAYRTVAVEPAKLAHVKRMFERHEIDAVTLGSPRTAQALLDGIGGPAMLSDTIVAAIGPTTAAALQQAGVRVDVVASKPDFDVLVEELIEPLRLRVAARRPNP